MPRQTDTEIRLVSCQYDGAQVMLPLGYFVDGHDTIWLAQLTSWERELYIVVRADARRTKPEMMLVTKGGGCGSA